MGSTFVERCTYGVPSFFQSSWSGSASCPPEGVCCYRESDPSGQRPRMLGHGASDPGQVSVLPKNSSVTLDRLLPLSEITVAFSVCLAHSRHSICVCLLALWAPVTCQRRALGPKSLLSTLSDCSVVTSSGKPSTLEEPTLSSSSLP